MASGTDRVGHGKRDVAWITIARMCSRRRMLFVVVAAVAGCKKADPPLELSGAAPVALGEVSAIVDGKEIKTKSSIGYFILPAGTKPESMKTVAFRYYETPCGPYDQPTKLQPKQKHERAVVADPADDSQYMWKHTVILDTSVEKAEVKIGKQAPRPGSGIGLSDSDGWNKATVGEIFATECGAKHDVSVGGKVVGSISGRPAEGVALNKDGANELPIFVTARAACYRLKLLAVDTVVRSTGGTLNRGDSGDWDFKGPGAFWLPLQPDVFLKEPDTAGKPSGLYEIPCAPPAEAAPAPPQ
jgi:hypothetical protein